MLLNRTYPCIKPFRKRWLLFLSVLLSLVIVQSCKTAKYKAYKEQYEIINYVFPPQIDSVLYDFFESSYNETNKRKWNIELGRMPYDNDMYYIAVRKKISDIAKHIEFEYINNQPSVKNNAEFLLYRTNRYAVVGKGKYIIPIYLDYDTDFVGYEKTEYPISSFTISGSSLFIKFKDWEVISISKHGVLQ